MVELKMSRDLNTATLIINYFSFKICKVPTYGVRMSNLRDIRYIECLIVYSQRYDREGL
jgi:hypothetical protein